MLNSSQVLHQLPARQLANLAICSNAAESMQLLIMHLWPRAGRKCRTPTLHGLSIMLAG
jgi:hypothetical protein